MQKITLNIESLTTLFEDIRLTDTDKMAEIEEIRIQLQQALMKIHISETRQNECEIKLNNLSENLNQFQTTETLPGHDDIVTTITSGDQIQLDSYKSIPEFSGNKNEYRSWREQVMRRMKMIFRFKEHPKYEAALGIIRAKITKGASDILINNNTAYNIDAIIDRLDFSYADQRPLYVVEAEMTTIKQSGKTLQEYYDAINQALNMVITKIVMSYKNENEQKSLINETQQKAVRTFIMGLKSPMTRNTLYGNSPKTLAKAFAIAQTIFYDNQHLQLDNQNLQYREMQRNQMHIQKQNYPQGYSPIFNHNKPQQPNRPEPMEVDTSARFRQPTNWRQQNPQMNVALKRDYNSSRQHLQQPQKIQKINQLQDSELQQQDGYEGDIAGTIPDDLISIASHQSNTASTFLDA